MNEPLLFDKLAYWLGYLLGIAGTAWFIWFVFINPIVEIVRTPEPKEEETTNGDET